MKQLLTKIRKAIATYGILVAIGVFAVAVVRYVTWLAPSRVRVRAAARQADLEFDQKWGVDTAGTMTPERSEVVGHNWFHGIRYEGSNAAVLERLLGELPINHREFTFVDFGSGKGRAILTAAMFPFKKVVGVEYSAALNEIARRNVERFPTSVKRCPDIVTVCEDAAQFGIPDGPLVVFLYNPFGKPVMTQVIENLRQSHQYDPRRMLVLYFNPLFGQLWSESGFVREVAASGRMIVFDSHPEQYPGSSSA